MLSTDLEEVNKSYSFQKEKKIPIVESNFFCGLVNGFLVNNKSKDLTIIPDIII